VSDPRRPRRASVLVPTYVPRSAITYFPEGVGQVARLIEPRDVVPDVDEIVLLRDVSRRNFYVFTPEDFNRALARVLVGSRARLTDQVEAELDIAGRRPTEIAQERQAFRLPTVIMDGAQVRGLVLPLLRDERYSGHRFLLDIPRWGEPEELPPAATVTSIPVDAGHVARSTPQAPRRVVVERPAGARKAPAGRKGVGTRAPLPSTTATDDFSVPTIRRTPHMQVPKRIPRRRGSIFEVIVRLDSKPFSKGESGHPLEIEAPPEVKSIELGVLLTVTPHFGVRGTPYVPVVLDRDCEETEPVLFTLEVVDVKARGDAAITAEFVYNGRVCGRVDRAWHWQSGASEADVATGREKTPPGTAAHVGSSRPDLTILITAPGKMAPGGHRVRSHYQASVITTRIKGWAQPRPEIWPVPDAANRFVRERIREFESGSMTPAERRDALDAAGPELWQAAPEAFRTVLEKMVKARRRPRNIYIASDEPTMPWELMMPSWPDDQGVMVDRLPLGVEFPVGRWSKDDAEPPWPRVVVRNSFIIAPTYEGESALKAQGEIDFIEEHLSGLHIEDATPEGLDAFLQANSASLLHFVCHGEVADEDDVLILDGNRRLPSRRARRHAGLMAVCKAERPLIFLNACETGVHTPALVGGAGFPKAFGEIGATAIIAPLWTVEDTDARKIALRVYRAALREPHKPTLARVVRDLRAKAYAAKNPKYSYAAYVFYGDPCAKLERAPGAKASRRS
jgi:hypothetical protein